MWAAIEGRMAVWEGKVGKRGGWGEVEEGEEEREGRRVGEERG